MQRLSLVSAALFSALALAACASPSEALAFQPPAGWNAGPSLFGIVQLWTDPKRADSVVMLMRVPVSAGNQDASLRDRYLQNGRVVSNREIKICGAHPAHFSILEGTGKSGKRSRAELVVTVWNGTTYMSLYGRDRGQPADPNAESALKSVCLKK